MRVAKRVIVSKRLTFQSQLYPAMKRKLSAAIILALFAALFVGCATTQSRYGKKGANVLNIINVEKGSYSKTGPLTIGLNLSEIMPRETPSGDRVRLLAGLITIEDS